MTQDNGVPKILYKYRSLACEYTKKILSNGQVYFASTDELNDPFEKFFTFKDGTHAILTEQECERLGIPFLGINKPHKLTREQYTKYVLDPIRKDKTHGIFSLSENPKSIPMYAHYAYGFKGLCIGFDWQNFGLNFAGSYPPQKNVPRKIIYQDAPDEIDGKPEEWLKVFTTKSTDFSFEEEWRMFFMQGVCTSPNVRNAIREIIFGHNASKEDRNAVISLVSDLEQEIIFFITKPIRGKFILELEKYEHN